MKVSVAGKTLSASMAAALETMVDCSQISSEALETAYFIKDVNDLFDSFNSTGIIVKKQG
jgi:cyclopropane fatty-acyl-phospholipid synthase-like methyltransferase